LQYAETLEFAGQMQRVGSQLRLQWRRQGGEAHPVQQRRHRQILVLRERAGRDRGLGAGI